MARKELHSSDIAVEQRDPLVVPELGRPLTDEDRVDIAKPAGGYIGKQDQKYLGDLAFMEEPVKIVVHGTSDRDASKVTDYLAVNGVPAQILVGNKWVPCPYIPKGVAVIIKRKYLDVLARSKSDVIQTQTDKTSDGTTLNMINRTTHKNASIAIVEDKNPKGEEWFRIAIESNF